MIDTSRQNEAGTKPPGPAASEAPAASPPDGVPIGQSFLADVIELARLAFQRSEVVKAYRLGQMSDLDASSRHRLLGSRIDLIASTHWTRQLVVIFARATASMPLQLRVLCGVMVFFVVISKFVK